MNQIKIFLMSSLITLLLLVHSCQVAFILYVSLKSRPKTPNYFPKYDNIFPKYDSIIILPVRCQHLLLFHF